jgi:hypothetical protein
LIKTNVFYRDADNDGYVNLNDITTSCSYTAPSGYKNYGYYGYQDCNDNDPTKTISIALYPDTDNDGYGDHAANYTISCGPLAGYVTNNDDCDDTNANLHGAYYFADSDGDGYVAGDKILMCTDNNDPAYAAPPGYIAATYMFEQYSYPSNPHYADCNNQNPNINPGVQEAFFNTIDDDCNGYIDDAKIITETITSNTSLISCTLVNGAQAYRFKVRFLLSNNPELTVSKTTNSFTLSQIGNKYSINEIYGISVALKKDGVWQDYGVEKRIDTQISTQVVSEQCEATITSLGNYIINYNKITNAVGYQVWINNGKSNYTLYTTNNYFNFNGVPSDFKKNNSKFAITIQTKGKNGVFYSGATCRLVVPIPIRNTATGGGVVPQTSTVTIIKNQCGHTITTLNSRIYSTLISKVTLTSFTFEITNNTTNEMVTYTTPNRYFVMKELPLTGFGQFGTSYSIRVRAASASTNYPFGAVCIVTTPAAPIAKTDDTASALTQNFLIVNGYPNPFSFSFSLDFNSSSSNDVEIKIFDMLGRLLDYRMIKPNEVTTQIFGEKYPAGIYNILVSQDNETKTVRMIKK